MANENEIKENQAQEATSEKSKKQDNVSSSDTPEPDNEVEAAKKEAATENDDTKVEADEKPTNVIHDRTKDPPKEDLKTEDNLELHSMSRKERRKYKRERYKETTAEMTRSQKISYYIYCYKWRFIITVAVAICVVSLAVTLYKNNRPVALSYAIVNSTVTSSELDMSVIEEDYMEYYGFGNDYQVRGTYDLDFDLETYDEDYSNNPYATEYVTFPSLCYNDYFDVIITDEAGLNYLSYNSYIHPLDDSMTADLYNIITSEYSDLITYSINYAEEDNAFAIDISDTEFAKSIGLGYDDVYICFPGTSEDNYYNVKRLCKFIFELDMDI